MPEKHRRYLEAKQFDGHRYRSWAKNIGPEAAHIIDKMLRACHVEEQSYKACMGLLQLSKKYGDKLIGGRLQKGSCTKLNELYHGLKYLKTQPGSGGIKAKTGGYPCPRKHTRRRVLLVKGGEKECLISKPWTNWLK